MFKKAMVYLGFGPDEAYDDYATPAPVGDPGGMAAHPRNSMAGQTAVRPISNQEAIGSRPTVRPVPSEPGRNPGFGHQPSAVRTLGPDTTKPHAISPGAFNDAQAIGDRFKAGQPVIVNLQALDRDLRRRLVDFSSGLCYALDGKMDRVADQVYLLIPAHVEVSQEQTEQAVN